MSTAYEKVKSWVLDQQESLDLLIANTSVDYFNDHFRQPNFTFDVKESIREMGILNSGGDLCYDRPSIAFTYSLWYHGKRLNGMLDYFMQLLVESRNDKHIDIFDLGAGTGAIQWAVGITYAAMKENGLPIPKIRIINIDSSPFMLEYNEKYLWSRFLKEYPQCEELEIEYRLISWVNQPDRDLTNVWLCASYLFDHSENRELIAQAFKDLAEEYRPQKIVLLGNWKKKNMIDQVAQTIAEKEYMMRKGQPSWNIFKGEMRYVHERINRYATKRELPFYGIPKWDNETWWGRLLEPQQTELGFVFQDEYNLYQKAEKDRSKIKLTPEQEKASQVSSQPTTITGPAGCGKSVVLTEKIKNIVEQSEEKYNPELNILLTTFNKDLVKFLGDWLEKLLDSDKCTRRFGQKFHGGNAEYSYFRFKGSKYDNIIVMHFDLLPTRIGNITWKWTQPSGCDHKEYHLEVMRKAMESIIEEKSINRKQYTSILDENFLLEEYHRVKYGLQCHVNADYLQVDREGRGNYPGLQKNKQRRHYIVAIFRKYKSLLSQAGFESFIIRRERFLNWLQNGKGQKPTFTHVLVDELQDCCRADYDIFYALLGEGNLDNLTVAGDLAQSINIGTTARVPRPREGKMKNFDNILLEGSFRLPFRIGECIRPLSEKIKDKFTASGNGSVYEIRPYKGAPPGARPIFIYGKSSDRLVDKLQEVFAAYSCYDNRIETIDLFERSSDLINKLWKKGIDANGNIVQKIKGMEKPFVVWDTTTELNTENEIQESVYTILTRTTSILVILIRENTQHVYFDIIKDLEEDRLIFWDEVSRKAYHDICNQEFDNREPEDEEHDEDISEEERMEEEEI